MTHRDGWNRRLLVWAPSVTSVGVGVVLLKVGEYAEWVEVVPDTYAGSSVSVCPAGLVLLGVGALGCIAAGIVEATRVERRR